MTFNKKIAKEIAHISYGYVIDCILGYSDTGYDLGTSCDEFEQNFEEDLQERKIAVTERRIKIIRIEFEKMVDKTKSIIDKNYDKLKPDCIKQTI